MDIVSVAPLTIELPVIQVAIDTLTLDEGLRIGEAAVRAGADWLEVGTPLVTFEGVRAIGAVARAFPEKPVLADYKAMDGVRKYFLETARQGGRVATVCSVAADASIRTAVAAGRDCGVRVVSDLYAAANGPLRARQLAEMGVDSVYIHYGADERTEDPSRDPLLFLDQVRDLPIPVGVGTFSVEDGVRAIRGGAGIVAIGVPLILAADPEAELREYVLRVREAWDQRR